ncbi:MAG: hypothetical protein A3D44_04220 [Candidatus Staskawiczbacteria bacterium RIFCSPHIGHO2_02_FULL_42_22]|uniref:Uncharacterized protein n=1 Tax=Candidatus Staskawiczbacteria bacterium RIFCSPHIGHO2_02_FULL_42_22 TaxID=1802207 RepID=A0A1G2I4R5_9BACT|nr:MAG: hypothetical protein A3D44_04220 [Candidatus Staskawiczbacteria bacterium RIFCSPHIGHO2_02_FULL_42_22]
MRVEYATNIPDTFSSQEAEQFLSSVRLHALINQELPHFNGSFIDSRISDTCLKLYEESSSFPIFFLPENIFTVHDRIAMVREIQKIERIAEESGGRYRDTKRRDTKHWEDSSVRIIFQHLGLEEHLPSGVVENVIVINFNKENVSAKRPVIEINEPKASY